MVDLLVGSDPVKFLVDTGTSVNIISIKTLKSFTSAYRLEHTEKKIFAFESERSLPVRGTISATITYGQHSVKTELFVIDGSSESLLSCQDAIALKIISVTSSAKACHVTTGNTDYFAELRKINFPERLDKIDNQISSINIGVGNLQTSIQRSQEKIEKGFEDTNQNLGSGFSTVNDSIKYSQEKVTSDLASQTNARTAEIIRHFTEQTQLLKKKVMYCIVCKLVHLGLQYQAKR